MPFSGRFPAAPVELIPTAAFTVVVVGKSVVVGKTDGGTVAVIVISFDTRSETSGSVTVARRPKHANAAGKNKIKLALIVYTLLKTSIFKIRIAV